MEKKEGKETSRVVHIIHHSKKPKVHHHKPKQISFSPAKSVERMLIENFVNLQKAITNLAVRFDNLSDNMSKLLNLFEISAKSFAEKTPTFSDVEKDKEFLDKLNLLMDQNKTIAKGLTLMEEKLRERLYGQPQNMYAQQQNLNPPSFPPLPPREAMRPSPRPEAQ